MTVNIISIPEGTRVRITDKIRTHLADSAYLGEEGTVRGYDSSVGGYGVDFDNDKLWNVGTWTRDALEVIGEVKGTRPVIDFSTPSRATARDYAAVMQSRTIDEKHNKTLQRVQFGAEDVDAYALNDALLAAMRSGATRFGQSMVRRDFTRKVAHLGHITQAVLENHANQLPVYEGGPRSPRIASLEAVVEKHQSYIGTLENAIEGLRYAEKLWQEERGTLTQAASDERRRLCSEIDTLKEGVREAKNEIEELTDILAAVREIGDVRDKLVDDTAKERNTLGAVLAYVFERADEAFQAEIQGYWNGLLDGTGQDRS